GDQVPDNEESHVQVRSLMFEDEISLHDFGMRPLEEMRNAETDHDESDQDERQISREAFRKPANRRGPHRSGEELDRGDEKTAERQREEEEMVQKERTPSSLRIHRDPRS